MEIFSFRLCMVLLIIICDLINEILDFEVILEFLGSIVESLFNSFVDVFFLI